MYLQSQIATPKSLVHNHWSMDHQPYHHKKSLRKFRYHHHHQCMVRHPDQHRRLNLPDPAVATVLELRGNYFRRTWKERNICGLSLNQFYCLRLTEKGGCIEYWLSLHYWILIITYCVIVIPILKHYVRVMHTIASNEFRCVKDHLYSCVTNVIRLSIYMYIHDWLVTF